MMSEDHTEDFIPNEQARVIAPPKRPTARIVVLWSIALFIGGTLLVLGILEGAPYILKPFFPQGRFMAPVFRLLPLAIVVFWGIGVFMAHLRYRSAPITTWLVVIGLAFAMISPIWIFIIVLAASGGWNVQ